VSDRLSVLYFTNAPARGGAEEHVLTLLRGLDRGRYRPLLACTPAVADALSGDVPDDVPITPLQLRGVRDVAGAGRALAQLLRRERVTILHSHLPHSSRLASPIGWMSGVPLIVETPHVHEPRRRWPTPRRAVDRCVSRFVDQYIAVSDANRRELLADKRLRGEKVVVIHNGCDVARFDVRNVDTRSLRASLGFAVTDPVLVVVGRLEAHKGHRILLDALPVVQREFPAVRLVCVGDGTLRSSLEARVETLRLGEIVRFVGHRSDVPAWLALADLAVLPSLSEGLPMTAIEAMAASRAIVATDVGGTSEVVVAEETGLLVPPGDPGSLAVAISRLLREPRLRAALAEAGRRRAVERFNDARQVAGTEALYELARLRRGPVGVADRRLATAAGERR
jgi:glycosyltransferase involved in cell wall biosynthesis